MGIHRHCWRTAEFAGEQRSAKSAEQTAASTPSRTKVAVSSGADGVHEMLARDAQGCSCSGLTLVDAPWLIADGERGVGQHASRTGRQGCWLNVLVILGAGREAVTPACSSAWLYGGPGAGGSGVGSGGIRLCQVQRRSHRLRCVFIASTAVAQCGCAGHQPRWQAPCKTGPGLPWLQGPRPRFDASGTSTSRLAAGQPPASTGARRRGRRLRDNTHLTSPVAPSPHLRCHLPAQRVAAIVGRALPHPVSSPFARVSLLALFRSTRPRRARSRTTADRRVAPVLRLRKTQPNSISARLDHIARRNDRLREDEKCRA